MDYFKNFKNRILKNSFNKHNHLQEWVFVPSDEYANINIPNLYKEKKIWYINDKDIKYTKDIRVLNKCLCGHHIKFAFMFYNPNTKVLIHVGSECIFKFGDIYKELGNKLKYDIKETNKSSYLKYNKDTIFNDLELLKSYAYPYQKPFRDFCNTNNISNRSLYLLCQIKNNYIRSFIASLLIHTNTRELTSKQQKYLIINLNKLVYDEKLFTHFCNEFSDYIQLIN